MSYCNSQHWNIPETAWISRQSAKKLQVREISKVCPVLSGVWGFQSFIYPHKHTHLRDHLGDFSVFQLIQTDEYFIIDINSAFEVCMENVASVLIIVRSILCWHWKEELWVTFLLRLNLIYHPFAPLTQTSPTDCPVCSRNSCLPSSCPFPSVFFIPSIVGNVSYQQPGWSFWKISAQGRISKRCCTTPSKVFLPQKLHSCPAE